LMNLDCVKWHSAFCAEAAKARTIMTKVNNFFIVVFTNVLTLIC